jgi:hypothetical protein
LAVSFQRFIQGGKVKSKAGVMAMLSVMLALGFTGRTAPSGKEAEALMPELSLKGASAFYGRDKTPDKNSFSEITLSPLTLLRSAVTAQGELTHAIQ